MRSSVRRRPWRATKRSRSGSVCKAPSSSTKAGTDPAGTGKKKVRVGGEVASHDRELVLLGHEAAVLAEHEGDVRVGDVVHERVDEVMRARGIDRDPQQRDLGQEVRVVAALRGDALEGALDRARRGSRRGGRREASRSG